MNTFFHLIKKMNINQFLNAVAYKILPRGEILKYKPLTLSVFATFRCNLSCSMCAIVNKKFWKQDFNLPTDLSFNKFKKILDKFGKNLIFVKFSGGEPLLNQDVFKMAHLASSKGLITEISTNGILLNRYIPKILKFINGINISYNASDSKEYGIMHLTPEKQFEILIENTTNLIDMRNKLKKKLKISLSYVCTKDNFKKIPKFLELAKSLKPDSVYFNNLVYYELSGFEKDKCLYDDDEDVLELINNLEIHNYKMKVHLPKLYERSTQVRDCKYPFSVLTVAGNDYIFPCCSLFPPSEGYLPVDDVEIWNNEIFRKLRRKFIDKSLPLPLLCNRCNNRFNSEWRKRNYNKQLKR